MGPKEPTKKENPKAAYEKQAKELFGKMSADVLHFTTDGQAFVEAGDAKNHARSIGKKLIVTIKREDV